MPKPTLEELERTAIVKPFFEDLERTAIFRSPTDVVDPNEETKKFQKTIDDSEKLKISLSDSEDYQDSLEKIEKKKPIGFWEGITEDALFKIPVTGPMLEGLDLARIKLAAIRLNTPDFDWEEESEREKRRLDWEYGKPGLVPTMSRQEYLDRRNTITAESARQDDIDGVSGYINAMAEREERGYNFWGRVGQGLSILPAWMFEFALTGGLYRTGSASVKKLLQKHARSKLLAKTGGWLAGSAVRTTVGMPQRVFANSMRRSLNKDEGWATSIAMGWGETFIEAASEQAGQTITGALSYVAGGAINKLPFGSKFLSGLQKAWTKLAPDNTAAKFAKKIATKAGYSNLIGEIGEERLATILHGLVGTETFGQSEGADSFDRILAGLKEDFKVANLLSEAVVLSVPGAIKFSLGQLGKFADDIQLRKAIETEIGVSPEAAKKAVEIKNGEGGVEEADKYLSDAKTVGEKAADKVIAEAAEKPPSEPVAPITPEITPVTRPTAEIERPAEKVTASFSKYKKAVPNATEQEVVEALIEDGLRPPKDVLKKYDDLPSVQRILEQDEIDKAVKRAAEAQPVAKAEPAKTKKPEAKIEGKDVTKEKLSELRGQVGRTSERYGITQARAGKSLSKTEQNMLARLPDELDLGPWSGVLLYSPELKGYSKPEHSAIIKLIDRGQLKLFRESRLISKEHTAGFTYVLKKPLARVKPTGEEWYRDRWDSSKLGQKVSWVIEGKWITKKGDITKSGEKMAQTKWDELSPAAQNTLRQKIDKYYGKEQPPAQVRPKIKKEDLPSTKIQETPRPGDKEAGFVEIPPITTVGKIEAEHPNIKIEKPKKDIGLLQRVILTETNQAQNSGHPDIIAAANEMADTGMRIWQDIESQLHVDKRIYNQLPKEYRANKGEKFFELMDKEWTPEQVETSNLPEEVKLVLNHFKAQDESMRQEIIKRKRRMVKAVLMRQKKAQLQEQAEEVGIETKIPDFDKEGEEILRDKTKSELALELSEEKIPDDWGRPYSHIQHIFFGQYELQYIDDEGNTHFIGRAETQTEAYQKLADWKEARRNAGFDDADTVQLVASPELHIPFDVLRISRKHFYNLEKQIQEAADIERQEIEDGLRGIIGKRESKQKWWGALMHRKGAPEYSQDFWRVWTVQTSQFNRWKHLSAMNRKVEPLIERVRGEGLRGWAQKLEDSKDLMWGRKRRDAGRQLDEKLLSIPVVRNYVKPFALERWAGILKSVNYWRHLQTGRFYVINSLQLCQTLWPVVGEKGLYRGIKLYYSKEGQDILRKHKVAGIAGKLHEMGMKKMRKFERFLPAGASEIRNQGVAFLAMYDEGIKRGMSDADATRYGRLRGQLFTQFSYTPSDIPTAMRGPIGGLILQYKRFTIKNLELVSRLAREGNWGGVARWVGAITAIGGLSTFLKAISGLPMIGYLTYKLYKKIEDEYGKETADVVHHGLPGLVGIDMSGSITPIDVPYGENIYEKTGNLVFGPTGTTAVKIIEDVKRAKVAKEIGIVPRALKSFVDSSATIKQFVYLVKALEKDTANYDAKQRMQYKLETYDLWKKAFGFRAETETIQRMQFEAMMDLKQEYDETIDHVVLALIDGDTKEAEKLINDWHASFPEAPISGESIQRRLQERNLARMLPMTERAFKELPEGLKGAFVEKKE